MFTAENPQQYVGTVVGTGHCVPYCQECSTAPHTSAWHRGRKVRGGCFAPGTIIATFGPDGLYENATDGSSHAAVLLGEEPDGLRVYDQWVGQPVHERLIQFRGGEGDPCNDGDAYHVVIA